MGTNDKVLVPREVLQRIARALDRALGDTDPNFADDMTDDDIRDEYPVWWVTRELNAMLAADPQPAEDAVRVPRDDQVICPECCHQFRAIPVQVQVLLLAAGYMPPFAAPATQPAEDGLPEPFGYVDSQGLATEKTSTNFRRLLEYHRAGKPRWPDRVRLVYTADQMLAFRAEGIAYVQPRSAAVVGDEASEEMCDSVRYLLVALEQPGQTFGGVRQQCEWAGMDTSHWPDWTEGRNTEHFNKSARAGLIWHCMYHAALNREEG